MSVAILDLRLAAAPGTTFTVSDLAELLRRLCLDPLPTHDRRLLYHWQRETGVAARAAARVIRLRPIKGMRHVGL
jgi:hypothetical protein